MASNNGRRATEIFLNLDRAVAFREPEHDNRYRCVLVGACTKLNKLLGSSVFPDDSVGQKQVLHLQGVFQKMAGSPEAQWAYPMAFAHYMAEQPPYLSGLTHHLFRYIDRRKMGAFDLEDLLRAVYPSATRADCQRMTALVQKPEARPLSTRRSVQQQVVNIAKAFAACDADGSGALDLAEFTEAMAELGGYDEDQSRAIFLAADTDGSGLIELQEFLIWFKAEAAKLREGGQAHGIVLALQRESSGCDDGAFIRDQIRAAEGLASPRLMRHVPGSSPRPARMRSRIPNFSKLRSAGSSLPANLARMPTAGLAGQNSSFSTPGSSLSNMRARASAYGSGVF